MLKEVLMDGSHVTKAKWQSREDGTKEITLWLTKAGRSCLAELTADNVGRRLVVLSQGRVLAAPVIMSAINSGTMGLPGNWSQEELTRIMSAFKNGQTPSQATQPPSK